MFIDEIYSSNDNDEYYLDSNDNIVYTKKYLTERGYCCGNGCLNCPYSPKSIKGNKKLKNE